MGCRPMRPLAPPRRVWGSQVEAPLLVLMVRFDHRDSEQTLRIEVFFAACPALSHVVS